MAKHPRKKQQVDKGEDQGGLASAGFQLEPGEYVYDKERYRSDVEIPGYGSGLFVLLGIGIRLLPFDMGVFESFLNVASILIIIAATYSIDRTFLAHAYPRVVRLDEDGIEFESFGKCLRFETGKLEKCSVTDSKNGRVFVRIAEPVGKPGRFYLSCDDMRADDGRSGRAVLDYLFAQEERLNPDSLRVRARKSGSAK